MNENSLSLISRIQRFFLDGLNNPQELVVKFMSVKLKDRDNLRFYKWKHTKKKLKIEKGPIIALFSIQKYRHFYVGNIEYTKFLYFRYFPLNLS